MKTTKMKKPLFTALVLGATLACFGREVILPEADARIDGGAPETNFGSGMELFVRDGSGVPANDEKTYLQFDLGGKLGKGERFSEADLTLTTVRPGSPGVAGTFTIHGIIDNDDKWKEGKITWSNAPKNDPGSGSGLLDNTVVLATATLPAGSSRDVQITFSGDGLTEYLNWVAGAIDDPYGKGASARPTATVIITSTGGNAVLGAFYSDEATGIQDREPHLEVRVASE